MLIAAALGREAMTRAKSAGVALAVGLACVVAGLVVALAGGRKQRV